MEGRGASARREQIVVTSIPYGVDKGKLEEAIGEIIANRKLPQLLNLANESNEKDGLRIALEMKPGADPNLVMAYLYKHTALQENFAYNMTCLVPVPDEEGKERTRPERLGLKAILRHFLDFRLATVRRRFEYRAGAAAAAHPHPRRLPHHLQRPGQGHQDHPRERRQGRRRREA